jgi:NTP pyrophosphatase (non-canonical NTP hydrolase)
MRVSDYDAFVRATDQYSHRLPAEREEIAIYGLVGEIGSLVSAIKKQLLAESGIESWNRPNEEITEELGDVIWYCFSLAQVANEAPVNILTRDIALLKQDMTSTDEHSSKIQATLDRSKKDEFLLAVEAFPNTAEMVFRDYQVLAFLTARTEGKVLLEVCLAVLSQLGAELMRNKLPQLELDINTSIVDRTINQVLGEIAWHVSALTSLYGLSLDEVAEGNHHKVSFRRQRDAPTSLHDECYPESERFPHQFDVAFVTVGPRRSRLYMNGRQIGNELTDNAYDDDGYRFHDVMHLANTAKLGWSPVFRSVLGRKRKSNPVTDEVEDGARAQIVEELIVKAIHSEGLRVARQRDSTTPPGKLRLFSTRGDVTFKLLKSLQSFALGLEVHVNKSWEWEDAILEGSDVFHRLRQEGQGTVSVNLDVRSMAFRPEVDIDLQGVVAGLGTAVLPLHGDGEAQAAEKTIRIQRATLAALGLPDQSDLLDLVEVATSGGKMTVRARGELRKRLWELKVITFRVSTAQADGLWTCTVLALTDPRDAMR